MAEITGIGKEVLEKTEWVAVATAGPDGPHVVATWGDYIRSLGLEGDRILIPVGGMRQTEMNLGHDNRVELLCGTRQVQGTRGPGKGCSVVGRGEMLHSGSEWDAVGAKFPWARAVLVITIDKMLPQL
jgi:hypothetical protein